MFDKDNSSLIFNGFLNASTNTLQTNNNARTICLPCEPNTTYTISKVLSQRFLRAETSSDTIQANIEVSNLYGNASLTEQHIITGANAKYILIFYYLSTADTLSEETIRNSIMINYGSTALPYEPYGSGKWYKKEYIYKIANKTNWSVDNVSSNNRAVISLGGNGFPYSSDIGYASANAISNNFIGISQLNQASTTSINNISINNANMYIKFADTINTTALVKTQLDSMTNLEIYYGLATPNDIEITNETLIEQLDNLEKLKSYNGTTNINCSGNLSAILDVSALKGE